MSAKCKVVKWNKTREVKTGKNFSGERSAYWEWARKHNRTDENGFVAEPTAANPDILPEYQPVEPGTRNRQVMKEVMREVKLSRREKAVLDCLGIQGFTEEKTAEVLGMSRRSVRTLLARAQKKCEKILVAKMAHADDIGER